MANTSGMPPAFIPFLQHGEVSPSQHLALQVAADSAAAALTSHAAAESMRSCLTTGQWRWRFEGKWEGQGLSKGWVYSFLFLLRPAPGLSAIADAGGGGGTRNSGAPPPLRASCPTGCASDPPSLPPSPPDAAATPTGHSPTHSEGSGAAGEPSSATTHTQSAAPAASRSALGDPPSDSNTMHTGTPVPTGCEHVTYVEGVFRWTLLQAAGPMFERCVGSQAVERVAGFLRVATPNDAAAVGLPASSAAAPHSPSTGPTSCTPSTTSDTGTPAAAAAAGGGGVRGERGGVGGGVGGGDAVESRGVRCRCSCGATTGGAWGSGVTEHDTTRPDTCARNGLTTFHVRGHTVIDPRKDATGECIIGVGEYVIVVPPGQGDVFCASREDDGKFGLQFAAQRVGCTCLDKERRLMGAASPRSVGRDWPVGMLAEQRESFLVRRQNSSAELFDAVNTRNRDSTHLVPAHTTAQAIDSILRTSGAWPWMFYGLWEGSCGFVYSVVYRLRCIAPPTDSGLPRLNADAGESYVEGALEWTSLNGPQLGASAVELVAGTVVQFRQARRTNCHSGNISGGGDNSCNQAADARVCRSDSGTGEGGCIDSGADGDGCGDGAGCGDEDGVDGPAAAAAAIHEECDRGLGGDGVSGDGGGDDSGRTNDCKMNDSTESAQPLATFRLTGYRSLQPTVCLVGLDEYHLQLVEGPDGVPRLRGTSRNLDGAWSSRLEADAFVSVGEQPSSGGSVASGSAPAGATEAGHMCPSPRAVGVPSTRMEGTLATLCGSHCADLPVIHAGAGVGAGAGAVRVGAGPADAPAPAPAAAPAAAPGAAPGAAAAAASGGGAGGATGTATGMAVTPLCCHGDALEPGEESLAPSSHSTPTHLSLPSPHSTPTYHASGRALRQPVAEDVVPALASPDYMRAMMLRATTHEQLQEVLTAAVAAGVEEHVSAADRAALKSTIVATANALRNDWAATGRGKWSRGLAAAFGRLLAALSTPV